ncbi:hypothetical protein BH10PSE15_BH10PSE15_09570 [soil metagenome]
MRGALNRPRAVIGIATLLFGLLAIGTTFVSGMTTASRYFERAAAAQAQLASVSQIEAMALGGTRDSALLDALLVEYRRSIVRESALIGDPLPPAQAREAADATLLGRLARAPGDGEDLRSEIARIATRERGEAQSAAIEMHGLRLRMVALAVILTGGAAALALAGGWALLAANRKLEREVATRTTDLAESNAKLVEIDRSRRLFFAKTGHELRTPITALRGEAEVALADPAPTLASLREALVQSGVQADLLGRRVEDLLALARADEGKITLRRAPFDLPDAVAQAIDLATPHARSAGIALAVDGATAPIALLGDAKWLVQALVAILENGVKFAPGGSTLALSVAAQAATATIAVRDVGPGGLPTALPRVFDAYYQSETGAARGGSGLGLALARWVVEQHGGTIAARNDNPGCTILLTLPVAT